MAEKRKKKAEGKSFLESMDAIADEANRLADEHESDRVSYHLRNIAAEALTVKQAVDTDQSLERPDA